MQTGDSTIENKGDDKKSFHLSPTLSENNVWGQEDPSYMATHEVNKEICYKVQGKIKAQSMYKTSKMGCSYIPSISGEMRCDMYLSKLQI